MEATYKCKNCGKEIKENDIKCPHCQQDLSKVGRHISIMLSDSITLSDAIKLSEAEFKETIKHVENIHFDSNYLAVIGILFTLIVGLIPLFNIWIKHLILSCVISLATTLLVIIVILKTKPIKRLVIRFLRWLIK